MSVTSGQNGYQHHGTTKLPLKAKVRSESPPGPGLATGNMRQLHTEFDP